MKKKSKQNILTILLILSLLFTGYKGFMLLEQKSTTQELTYNKFKVQLNKGNVKEVDNYDIENPVLSGKLKNGKLFKTDSPQTEKFKEVLLEKGVNIKKHPNIVGNIVKWSILSTCMLMLFLIVIQQLKTINKISSDIKLNLVSKMDITFDDIAGNEEAKEDMSELAVFLKDSSKFRKYGAKVPRGTLLYGPPGTGKTLLAKGLAGSSDASFISVSGSDFVEKFVGVGASRIRKLFETARKNAPCIIFIDEIDAIGQRREDSGLGGNDERNQTLNQLLIEMDGFSDNDGIIVIGATNRLEALDPALLRSGRLGRHIKVNLPDLEARYEILKLHSKDKPLNEEVELKEVARMTTFMSGADLENIMNEASIYAARNSSKGITMRDIDRAINKVIAGEEIKNRDNIRKIDKKITAYHEAGHVIVSKLLTKKEVSKVTIIPTTKGAGGYALITPEEKLYDTKKDMLNDIAISLGGRIAEEIIFGEDYITGGASEDIKNVTKIGSRMIKEYGMSKEIGLVNAEILYSKRETNEDTAKEVKLLIDEVYRKTKFLLIENKSTLENMASELIKRETLYEKDINEIINPNPLLDKIAC